GACGRELASRARGMGRHPIPEPLSAPRQSAYAPARLRRLGRDPLDRRSGDAYQVCDTRGADRVSQIGRFRARSLQRAQAQLSFVGWAVAPADPGCHREAAGDGLAAARLPPPIHRARYARHRQAGEQLPRLCPLSGQPRNGGAVVPKVHCGIVGVAMLAAALLAPAAASAYTVYVTNEKDNTVSLIDSATLEVVKTVKVGQRPRGLTLSKDHRWLLICA